MTREAFIALCDRKEKLVRNELGYSQEKMSSLLGVSKKTLVEIEKWRSSLGWQGAVTLCTLFANTREITLAFGTDIPAFLQAMTEDAAYLQPIISPYAVWNTILQLGDKTIEQNTASQLYRLRAGGETLAASFELAELRKRCDV